MVDAQLHVASSARDYTADPAQTVPIRILAGRLCRMNDDSHIAVRTPSSTPNISFLTHHAAHHVHHVSGHRGRYPRAPALDHARKNDDVEVLAAEGDWPRMTTRTLRQPPIWEGHWFLPWITPITGVWDDVDDDDDTPQVRPFDLLTIRFLSSHISKPPSDDGRAALSSITRTAIRRSVTLAIQAIKRALNCYSTGLGQVRHHHYRCYWRLQDRLQTCYR
ncbi:hypothetical protein C8F01DRAFT_1376064 [Mycena amicta]|nr:hypothetical protein C8F01DRAFT_1376064 [Mycena amicta]